MVKLIQESIQSIDDSMQSILLCRKDLDWVSSKPLPSYDIPIRFQISTGIRDKIQNYDMPLLT